MKTKAQLLKSSLLSSVIELASAKIEDIETGIKEGLYEDDQANKDELKRLNYLLKEAKDFEAYEPSIYIYVEGGNIQGISGSETIDVNIYDKDNEEADDKEYHAENGTPEEWDAKIKELEKSEVIKGIY